MIPFGPLAPDAGETTQGTCMIANGVVPSFEGYTSTPLLVTTAGADALPDAPRGAVTGIRRSGGHQVFVLTETSLYRLEVDFTYTEIHTGYSVTAGDDFSCIQFGDWILYTNTTNGLWAYNMETAATPTYIAEAGLPRDLFICGNMIFGLDCDADNRMMRNSDFNQTEWVNGAADYQIFADGGALIAGRPLSENAALILQENALRLLKVGDAGGGALYSLALVAEGRGSVGSRSVVAFDGAVYALSTIGFFRFSLTRGLEWIGSGKVDEWFLSRVPTTSLHTVQAVVDPSRKVVLWRYPTVESGADVFDNVIGYSWEFNRWFTWTASTTYMSRISTSGYTLATMTSAFGTLAGCPDIGIGARFWQGGEQVLAALDEDRKYATFSGGNMAAQIRTATINNQDAGMLTWITPIDDAANSTVSLGVKDQLSDTFTWKTAASKVSGGRVPIRGKGHNIAFDYAIAAGETWTHAKGLDHPVGSGGGRR